MGPFLPLLLFALALGASHASSPAEDYWHKVLPNTPMPSAVTDLLLHAVVADEKSGTAANVGKGGVNVTGKDTSVSVGYHGRPVNVNVNPYYSGPFLYNYAATKSQIQDPSVTLFFLEEDLHPGAKMTLHFIRTTIGATLLPRRAADSIPFSSAKLPAILSRLSIAPNSIEAKVMNKTLHECEEPAIDGETKYCATSVESMVDFSTSSLGTRNVRALSTAVGREGTPKQVYAISDVQELPSSKLVVCHGENYAYAVFYCHTTSAVAYKVSLVGKDGTKVEAVATCHTNTTGFNPEHVAFKVLDVKPGTVPVCHFLPQNDIVWSRNK
ncbi:BURP domain-containing protein 6-like [Phoenix dactylifera]|uniref:BURP domain-containing protein 6-like n=1 Tax=Phoenix dactylifera TaxID=42345 RepID=A0A8B9AHJ9_PHODC|nr:BURP domain-containing protein 6-like [Phoenix dactylifera]